MNLAALKSYAEDLDRQIQADRDGRLSRRDLRHLLHAIRETVEAPPIMAQRPPGQAASDLTDIARRQPFGLSAPRRSEAVTGADLAMTAAIAAAFAVFEMAQAAAGEVMFGHLRR